MVSLKNYFLEHSFDYTILDSVYHGKIFGIKDKMIIQRSGHHNANHELHIWATFTLVHGTTWVVEVVAQTLTTFVFLSIIKAIYVLAMPVAPGTLRLFLGDEETSIKIISWVPWILAGKSIKMPAVLAISRISTFLICALLHCWCGHC